MTEKGISGLDVLSAPFLIWFHRLSHLVGYVSVPSAAKLLPERWPRRAFALHTAALVSGACALLLRSDLAARVTGLLLVLLALQMLLSLWHLARYRAPALLADDTTQK
ncbi:MAG TPA: hypothetical protein VF331_16220 [Polyangiales bacterium]